MDLAQLLQACEAPDDAQVFLVMTESEHRMVQRLLKQKPPLDDTKVFLAVTETEHAVLQRLLSREPEPSLLRALEALGISETICERLAATLLARLICQEPGGEC